MSVPLTIFLTFLVTSLLSSVITYLCITKRTKRPPKVHCEYFTRTKSDAIYDTVSVNPSSGGNVFEMKNNEAYNEWNTSTAVDYEVVKQQ